MKCLKYLFITVGLLFACTVIAADLPIPSAALPMPTTSTENLNRVVATVNNDVITQDEFNAALTQASQQLAASANPNAMDPDKLKEMVLQQLIDQKLQLELAAQANLTVTNAEVSQAISRIAEGYHFTPSQLKEKLAQEGMSYDAYQKLIHKQLLVHKVQESAIGAGVTVTDQDIQTVRTQYQAHMNAQRAFHIIDAVCPDEKTATQVIKELQQGKNSKNIREATVKDLGWKTGNDLPNVFLATVSSMKPGDISKPIQAPNGLHVLQLVAVKGNDSAISEAQLRNYAYQMKFQQAVEKWLKTVRKTAYIKIAQ